MNEWFSELDKREQRLVISAGALIFVFFIYSLAWQPLIASVELLRTQTASQNTSVEWMRSAATEVKQLRRSGGTHATLPEGQSLLALVDKTTKISGINAAVKRIQPKGKNGAQVRLEKASFDKMVAWLNNLKHKQGITATSISVEKLEVPGTVNARISLEAAK